MPASATVAAVSAVIRKRKYPTGRVKWQLDLGYVQQEDGTLKRMQPIYDTEDEAKGARRKFEAKRTLHGEAAASFPEALRMRYHAVEQKLAAVGATIEQAGDYFLRHHRALKPPLPLALAVTQCIAEKEQLGTLKGRSANTFKCSCLSFIAAKAAPRKATFDLAKLEHVAGEWANTVDLVWLANRSAYDPALVKSAKFLSAIYKPGEKVIVFTNDKTQGEAVWPADELPTTGKLGVWFLCQPVTGEFMPNPRGKIREDGTTTPSRRIEECVTDWRFLVLESDEAPPRLWLGALAQLPLRIAAIYTSGGRSIHALIRIDALTKAAWDAEKHKIKDGLVILGADPRAMSAVRLTRLPGTTRQGKMKEDGNKRREDPLERRATDETTDADFEDMKALVQAIMDKSKEKVVEVKYDELIAESLHNALFGWIIEGKWNKNETPAVYEPTGRCNSRLGLLWSRKYGGRVFSLSDGRRVRFGMRGRQRHKLYTLTLEDE